MTVKKGISSVKKSKMKGRSRKRRIGEGRIEGRDIL
jgi:hypothetical protein